MHPGAGPHDHRHGRGNRSAGPTPATADPTTAAELHRPYSVTAADDGTYYIADAFNHAVRKVNPAGIITTIAGSGTAGYSGDNGPAGAAQLNQPTGLALDADGNLYVADIGNQRIRMIDSSTGTISTVAGDGTLGFGGDGGAATSAQLTYPREVAIDADGELLIADTSNNRVRKVDSTGKISTIAGIGTAGFSGDAGPATSAELNRPLGLTADSGNIYIADSGNSRVRKIDSTGTITTFAGTGVASWYGDGGPATNAWLNRPGDVAMTADGILLIADTLNNAVRCVMPDGTIATPVGFGYPHWGPTGGFGGDGDTPTKALLEQPQNVAVDSAGNIYIADERNSRVRKVFKGGASVSGNVILDGTGEPVTGATVNLYLASDLSTPVQTTTTWHGIFGFRFPWAITRSRSWASPASPASGTRTPPTARRRPRSRSNRPRSSSSPSRSPRADQVVEPVGSRRATAGGAPTVRDRGRDRRSLIASALRR